jgi:hypothetical protein
MRAAWQAAWQWRTSTATVGWTSWPDGGETQVYEDVPLDAWLGVTEGTPAFERLEWKTYRF